jgi:hypothetical protein
VAFLPWVLRVCWWFQIGLFAGLFCCFLELFTLLEHGVGTAMVDVGRGQVADPFVVVFVTVPVEERLQRAAALTSRSLTQLNDAVDRLIREGSDSPVVQTKPATPPAMPKRYALYQNYPNPFNPRTEIRFDLPETAPVTLKVFNTNGQLVTTLLDETRAGGSYTVTWDGSRAASGMYVVQLKAGSYTDTKKMMLIK